MLPWPQHRSDALAADAQRHFGARDHEGTREAAGQHRPAGSPWRRNRGRAGLRQLVNAPLQELLIGAQIGQFVGGCDCAGAEQQNRRRAYHRSR
jgi:hypothetical protein